jgi:orotate phosphoribosyltransferase
LDYFGKPDLIAGIATGGVPQGVLVAQELGVPFIYVRSSPKDHGMGNIIEGYFEKGQRVVVIEDLISTGGSSIKAIQSLREAGLDIKGLVAIFSYGFEIATKNFADAECPVLTLSDYDTLVDSALKTKYITEDDIVSLHKWREKPEVWKP